jgi:hypothetical protein
MDKQSKVVVGKSILDEFLDGFREWRDKKSEAKTSNVFYNILMAILNGIMYVVFAFLRPAPFLTILFMVYVFFLLGQYKDAQEIEAGAINPQVEQIPYQPMPIMPTEMDGINAQLERAKAMIRDIEASNQRQQRELDKIVNILKERHGIIIQ